jgi:isopentenyl-diphosphate delta-isomerase
MNKLHLMEVILVDDKDKEIGRCEKIMAHQEGLLHRAFSIFIFNKKKELLIQKRAIDKYHSGGLWSNTCCSHPLTSDIKKEASLRLFQEIGISPEIKEIFCFLYTAKVEKLIENEYDHVFLGYFDSSPNPDNVEVMDWTWISLKELEKKMNDTPEGFTPWLRLSLSEVINFVNP